MEWLRRLADLARDVRITRGLRRVSFRMREGQQVTCINVNTEHLNRLARHCADRGMNWQPLSDCTERWLAK